MQVRGPSAATGTDPLGYQLGHFREVLGGHRRERGRAAHQRQQVARGPFRRGALRHHLLRQDVQRALRYAQLVEPPGTRAAQQCRAFHQLVARGRIEQPGRNTVPRMVGSSDPLQERGEAARRADLAYQLHRSDIDTQLQRRGRHQGPQVAAAQPGLDPLPAVPGQAAVMGRHLAVPETLAELVGELLGHPPGIDEDQRGPVPEHMPGDQVVDLGHLLSGGDRAELVTGQLQAEVKLTPVTCVDDRAARCPVGR